MILDSIEAARRDLTALGVTDMSFRSAPPVTPNVLGEVEERIGHRLPDALRQGFLQETGGVKWQWFSDLFGLHSRRGCAWLQSPQEMADGFEDQVAMAEEAKSSGETATSAGYQAMASDWPNWIPVFRFPSGDSFCLDMAAADFDPPIVFLEHDVMDGGPNLHGMRLAQNFLDLVRRWSSVLYVEVPDWTPVVDRDGIDVNAEIFRPLREHLRRLHS
jgi:hypothetical protein